MQPDTPSGIRHNLGQFSLLVVMNALVGALVGQERTLIPLLAEQGFGISSSLATSLFLVTFGLAKAPSNLAAGLLAERYGPRRVQTLGWLIGIPVPLMLMFGPSWAWVIAANLLLGINQGLTWSSNVLMKIQLAGDHERGRAVGLNEFSGYTAVGISAFVSGLLADAYGVRPEPFVLGIVVVAAGLVLSRWLRDGETVSARSAMEAPFSRKGPVLRTCARIGLTNNANDAFVWALMPVLLVQAGMTVGQVAAVAAAYPITWGMLQLVTGEVSDRIGRRAPIVTGMMLQAIALVGLSLSGSLLPSLGAAVILGGGTALAYPSLIAAVADATPERKRPSAIGAFRMWRDLGYVAGALIFGGIADLWGLTAAALAAAGVTTAAALDALFTLPAQDSIERLITSDP